MVDCDEDQLMGATIDEIFNNIGRFDRKNQGPPVIPSESHTVLFKLPLPDDSNEPIQPTVGADVWNDDYVKLPCSPSSVYTEINEEGEQVERKRWDLIVQSLTEERIVDSHGLEAAIKRYNTKFTDTWKFPALHQLFEDDFSEEDTEYFFEHILPLMVTQALKLPELIKSPIPLLKKKSNHCISLTQKQISCLLANAFFCTFPKRNQGRKYSDFPEINFNRLFSSEGCHVREKIKCLLNYFKRICQRTSGKADNVVTFQRRYVKDFPNWNESEVQFSSLKLLVSSDGTIEDATSMLQVDFANRYLGGGVLGWGCVQEEIRFVINPEMIVGMLFCESMGSEESILMIGCEQFNNYQGYSKTFKWCGNHNDEVPVDQFRRKMIYVVAMDAFSFPKPYLQFEEKLLRRELNKAFSGFYHDVEDPLSPVPVSSGNWGCGAFRGYKPLKALIQLMACALNRRNLLYYTFGEVPLMEEIHQMYEFLVENEVTVGQLFELLNLFRIRNLSKNPDELYPFIRQEVRHQKEIERSHEALIDDEMIEENNEEPGDNKSDVDGTATSERNVSELSDSEKPPPKRVRTAADEYFENDGDELSEVIVDDSDSMQGNLLQSHEPQEPTSEKVKKSPDETVLEIEETSKTNEVIESSNLDKCPDKQHTEENQKNSDVSTGPSGTETVPSTPKSAKITDFFKRTA